MIAVQVTAAVSVQAGAGGWEKPVVAFSSGLVWCGLVVLPARPREEIFFFFCNPPHHHACASAGRELQNTIAMATIKKGHRAPALRYPPNTRDLQEFENLGISLSS